MLRRMKDRARDGLPSKESMAYRVNMPPIQAEAYRQIVVKALADADTKRQMLETLHRLRAISLHPRGAVGVDTGNLESANTWLNESARMRKSVEVLRQLKDRGAKAIVFVEDLAIQRAFAEAMATIFDLDDVPGIINGGVPGDKRQKVVDDFQGAPNGFGLLVLSPKAAGVGLTITAANHVIHLSRWWNPAVEDQCNDRAYRIGQTRDVTIHLPMAIHPKFADDSFDARLNELLERKRSLSRNMLCPPESANDVTELFANIVR
jgi:SNF2 family DNA or RNA helicase